MGKTLPYTATPLIVELPDGDRILLHEDRPKTPSEGTPIAVLLVYGLSGCHDSGYMARCANKLVDEGVRTYRMDMRGCSSDGKLSNHLVHAGRSDDIVAAIRFLRKRLNRETKIIVVGFSLGASIGLLMAGRELTSESEPLVDGLIAVSPPIDLAACCQNLESGANRFYSRYFAKRLVKTIRSRPHLENANRLLDARPFVRTLYEFDARVTAPLGGFADVDDYYSQCSAKPWLPRIRIPTLLIVAENDPIVPTRMFDDYKLCGSSVNIALIEGGGHLGFLSSRRGGDPDRHWLDWRIVEQITSQRFFETVDV